ncbi:COG1361 family protein [Thalassoroseus pseudoceratinae]|uniref:DUF11 domain-containing protein n=1 Tax=Thalassoroseus pseudoceratinae TaxID=2713176 RepID=UPI00141F1136|nr:DUF11 domain-containing protein [Thalassoroseus pseudoceratinae]
MQTSLWKMTALMGVVGIGVLVVLQAQRGLSSAGKQEFVPTVADASELDRDGDRRADEADLVPDKPSEPLRFAAEQLEFAAMPQAVPDSGSPRALPTNLDVPTPVEAVALPVESPTAFRRQLPDANSEPVSLEESTKPLGRASVSNDAANNESAPAAGPQEIRVALNEPAPFGSAGASSDAFGAGNENPFFDAPEPTSETPALPSLPNPEPDPNGGAFDEPAFPEPTAQPTSNTSTDTSPEFDPYEPKTAQDSGPSLPVPAGPFDDAPSETPKPAETAATTPVLPELAPSPEAAPVGRAQVAAPLEVASPTKTDAPTPAVDMRTPVSSVGPEEDPLTAFGLVPEKDDAEAAAKQPEPADPGFPEAAPLKEMPLATAPANENPFGGSADLSEANTNEPVAELQPEPQPEPTPTVAVEPEPAADPLDNLTFDSGPALGSIPSPTPPKTDPTPNSEPTPIPSAPVPTEKMTALEPEPQPEPETKSAAIEPAPTVANDDQRVPGSIVTRPEELTGDGVVTDPSLSEHERPQLKIEKVAPPRAVLGEPMVYKIVVRNVGQRPAHQVVVEDQIPKGTRLTGTIPRAELSSTTLRWKLGKLEAGNEKVISVRVIPLSEGNIGSVAKVNFVAEVAAQTVITSPKISLTMNGPTEAAAGSELTYTFKVTNTGQTAAEGVYLRNLLPTALTHPGGNDLEYEVGKLAAGETKEVSLTVSAVEPGTALNKAIVTASGGVKVEASRQTAIVGTRLSITRTGPTRRFIGRAAVYENTVQNDSSSVVRNIRVVETVPAGMQFVSATNGGQYDAQQNTITWTVPQLTPQGQQKMTVQFLPTAAGAKKSTVIASEGVGGEAVVESQTDIEGYTALRLDVAELRDPVDVGEEIALRFITKNRGTNPATNVRVSFTLSPELQLVSANGPTDAVQDGGTVRFTPLPSVAGEMKYDVVLKAVKPGSALIGFDLQSDQMSEPLHRDEPLRVLPPE